MNPDVEKAWLKALSARGKLRVGHLTLDEAKEQCEPYIRMVNDGAKRMSREYGNPYKPVSATGFLR